MVDINKALNNFFVNLEYTKKFQYDSVIQIQTKY